MPMSVALNYRGIQLLARHTSAAETATARCFNNQASSFTEAHRGSWPKLLTFIRFVLDNISTSLARLTARQAKWRNTPVIR
jgi:hypothetical protein